VAEELAKSIKSTDGNRSLDIVSDLAYISDPNEIISYLFYYSEDTSWLYVVLKLVYEGKMSRKRMEKIIRDLKRYETKGIEDLIRTEILEERDEALKDKELDLYRDIFCDSPKSQIPDPYPRAWTT